jgi:hypothetical protein
MAAVPAETGKPGRLRRQLLPIVVALAVLGGASWLSYSSARHSFDTTVTAFSAQPPGPGNALGLRPVQVTATGLVTKDAPYTVVVIGEGGRVIQAVQIAGTGDLWSATMMVPSRQRTTIVLRQAGSTTPYRTILLGPES